MRLVRSSLYAFAVMGLLAGGAYAQSVKETIEAANADFMKAFNGKDSAGVGALYDEDAALLPPNELRVEGRENIQKYWQGGIDIGFTALTLTTAEVQEAGDWAYEVGTYSGKYPDKTGKIVDDIGKYVVIWKKSADGKWRLYRDIWNNNPAKTE